jgi:ferritin-like metal-binding protein YciE
MMKKLKRNSTRKKRGNHEGLKSVFENDLKDIYWAENHLVNTLPKMAMAVVSDELRQALEDHLRQTEDHADRLKTVFEICSIKPAAKKCEGMEGLIKEGEEAIRQFERGIVRDAEIIIAAQKVEHYEIAAYGSLRTLAEVLGFSEAAALLQRTLDEEKEADKLLTALSESVNKDAYQEKEEYQEEM